MAVHCAHCGELINEASRGHVGGHPLHHTGTVPPQQDPIDCYRLVTVYKEPMGSRKKAAMPGSKAPIPDGILSHIRGCVAVEHAEAYMAAQWQLAIDHRRWLLAETDRLRGELADAQSELEFLRARAGDH